MVQFLCLASVQVSFRTYEVALLGPPFTHPSIPYAAHFVGASTPRSNPSFYLDCIRALIETYNLDIQNDLTNEDDFNVGMEGSGVVPLVVNTMGWSKGLGWELTKKIEDILDPSDIFEIDSTNVEEEWTKSSKPGHGSSSTATVHVVESITGSPLSTHYSAADRRTLSILSYFHAIFPPQTSSANSTTAVGWTTSSPLCDHPPYEVNWKVAFDQVILIGAGMEDVLPEELSTVLNCSIVGLVDHGTEPFADTSYQEQEQNDASFYVQGASAPSPFRTMCKGLALIRSFSDSSATPIMHILTPLPHASLKSRILVKSELELPVWGMLDFRTMDTTGDIAGIDRGKIPFLRWGKGEGAGAERRRVRRNLMRRGQI